VLTSDKQKGLINDAKSVRYLLQNFVKAGHRGELLKNNLWSIARSANIPKWQHNMDKMKADSVAAYEWVEALAPNTWIKAFFSDFSKCDVLLNNHSEVFNSYILEAREMPVIHVTHHLLQNRGKNCQQARRGRKVARDNMSKNKEETRQVY
jgi:hypothetical protein